MARSGTSRKPKQRPPIPITVTDSGALKVSAALAAFGADNLYRLIEDEVAAWREAPMAKVREPHKENERPPVPVTVTESGGLKVSAALAAFGADNLYRLIEEEVAAWRESHPPRTRKR